ncbi:MAG TPA: cytochrome c oxidase assembly protein [Polyangiaceae bacterium]|nr:cytochrome c oxidase assembly protein [Polyangiaceae bacterium]
MKTPLLCAWTILHPGHGDITTLDVLRSWTPDPVVWLALATMSSIYAFGVSRLWRNAGRGSGISVREATAYGAGIFSLIIALVSPLDYLSDYSFLAHMSQHELLMLVAAPLVALGRPAVAFFWALAPAHRRVVARTAKSPALRTFWRALSHPVTVLVLHGAVVWIWHARVLFDAAMQSEWIHGGQHLSFFVTAVLFWWAIVFGRYGRAGYGVGVLFVFATATHTSLLGVLLTLAQHVWYAAYETRASRLGLDALDDQRLGGLVMWIPGGATLLLACLALLLAWLGEARRRAGHATLAAHPEIPRGTPS